MGLQVTGNSRRRRGTVAAQVAVGLTVLVGFMALGIDVGAMYNVKAELQRTADAVALAAVAELGDLSSDPLARARSVGREYAKLNCTLGGGLELADEDFTFGSAAIDNASNKFVFKPTTTRPNAVRVRARRTRGSPSGPMPLYFARVLGFHETDVWARATAVLNPRDIAFVLDLSASHTFDSKLMHFKLTDVGGSMKGVWQSLRSSGAEAAPVAGGEAQGPVFGNMRTWGTDTVDAGWNYAADPGLTQLRRGTAWNLTSAWASQSLAAWRAKQTGTVQTATPAAYNAAEMSVINAAGGAGTETSTSSSSERENYRRRVLVALGIYRWKSGKSGGQPGGNGDNRIDASEVELIVPYPSSSSNPDTQSKQVGGDWNAFVDYVANTSKADNITSDTGLSYRFLKYDPDNSCYGDPNLRSRFGLKTFIDYVQDRHPSSLESPGLAGAPQQPMRAVADAVQTSIDVIKGLGGNDQVALVAYGTVGYGPADHPDYLSWLTTDFDLVRSKMGVLQAGMWTSNTNIAQGLDKAAEVLAGKALNSRPNAVKIIILLTDGNANQTRGNPTSNDEVKASADTLAAARDAHAAGCRIYTVAVGADADLALMQQVASIGEGDAFLAQGDIATYQKQLNEVFKKLGGKRPVALIE